MGNTTTDVQNHTTRTEIDAALEAAKNLLPVEMLAVGEYDETVTDVRIASLPAGRSLVSVKKFIDEYRTEPERRKGTATLTDLGSFIQHVRRFSDDDSVIFAKDDRQHPALVAVLDYHRSGPEGSPRFGEHRACYQFPLSDEWLAWNAQNGRIMSQVDFARFMEDRLVDVAQAEEGSSSVTWAKRLEMRFASASELLALSRGLQVNIKRNVKNKHDAGSGITQFIFESEASGPGGAPLDVPGAFLLSIPIFKRGDLYPVPARLRWRENDGMLQWFYELARLDAVFEHAFSEALDIVHSGRPAEEGKPAQVGTGLPILRGSPEV